MSKHLHVFLEGGLSPFKPLLRPSGWSTHGFCLRLVVLAALFSVVLTTIQGQQVSVQFIHVAQGQQSDAIDIYANGNLVVANLLRNGATPVLSFPPQQIGLPLTLAVAPGSSASVNDAFYTTNLNAPFDGIVTAVLKGEVGSLIDPFEILVDSTTQFVSADPAKTGVGFIHASSRIPAIDGIDGVLREGGMVFGALAHTQFLPYLNLAPIETFLDVKLSGTASILSTYRLSLEPYKGTAFRIVITGEATSATILKMHAVFHDGFTAPFYYPTVARYTLMPAVILTLSYETASILFDYKMRGAPPTEGCLCKVLNLILAEVDMVCG